MAVSVLLGVTGINKRQIASRLASFAASERRSWPYEYIDFEHDVLASFAAQHGHRLLAAYFDEVHEQNQARIWRAAWQALVDRVHAEPDKNYLIGLHACLIRPIYGVRSPVDVPLFAELGATRIVTLIDDVYELHRVTAARHRDRAYNTEPSLADLVEARRSELLIGDLLASVSGSLTNYLVSVNHPVRTLFRLLTIPLSELVTTYLSFPISEPRAMLRGIFGKVPGHESSTRGFEDVNSFIRSASDLESRHNDVTFFCPLTIDELPLLHEANWERNGQDVAFNPSEHRWALKDLYGDEPLIAGERASGPLVFREDELRQAAGQIETDVGRRDYRLVKQSTHLCVLNPVMNNRSPRGVEAEVDYAKRLNIPVFMYQNPAHDDNSLTQARYAGDPGQMGGLPMYQYVQFYESVEAALQEASRR